jgi:predicted RNA-binding Zn-ribbon protein involved in translation (DUF1610 family)
MMATTTQATFLCPHCGTQVKVQIIKEIDAARSENATHVSIEDLPPVRCEGCRRYAEVKISDLVIEYEAVPLGTTN